MKKWMLPLLLVFTMNAFCQPKKTDLYDFVRKLIRDSVGDGGVGDWAIGQPPSNMIQWKRDAIEMSDDLKINFFRKGSAIISVNGITYSNSNKPMIWSVMLRGPRAGYTNFNLTSGGHNDIKPEIPLDSLFGKKPYTAKMLKDCTGNPAAGYFYYQVKIPKKIMAWVRLSWTCNAGNCSLSLDCYDDFSRQYADLACSNSN